MSSTITKDAEEKYVYKGTVRVETDDDNQRRLEIEPLTGMFMFLEEDIIESFKLQLNGEHKKESKLVLASYEVEVTFKINRIDVRVTDL